MIYRASADAKIEVGNWPQFFKCVFHVYATGDFDAKMQAEQSLNEAGVDFEKLHVEFIGRRYEVLSNEEFSVAGIRYPAGTVSEIHVYPGTMQICIDCERYGRKDNDNIGLWQLPADFKKAVDNVFSKVTYKEI